MWGLLECQDLQEGWVRDITQMAGLTDRVNVAREVLQHLLVWGFFYFILQTE